jgi:hypothetical protein
VKVFKITFADTDPSTGRRLFNIVEAPFETVGELLSAMERDLVTCSRLHTRSTKETRTYEIIGRREVALRADDVIRVEVPFAFYVEASS